MASHKKSCKCNKCRRATATNRWGSKNSYFKILKTMEVKLSKAWNKFSYHIKNRAPINTLKKDNRNLLFLLGECNFIARKLKTAKKNYKY